MKIATNSPMHKIYPEVPLQQAPFYLNKRLRLGCTFLLLAALTSCGNLSQSGLNASSWTIGANVTPIKELKPQQKNATVYVQGKVEKVAPLLQRRAYQLNDSTGKIWAITNQTSLRVGEQAVIKGQLRYRSIPLAGKEFGEAYVEE